MPLLTTPSVTNDCKEQACHSQMRHAADGDGDGDSRMPPHPLNIKPLGNRYLSDEPNARLSVGTLAALPDEALMQLLEFLDSQSLRALGYTCKFLFAFCSSEELWKPLFIESQEGKHAPFKWQGTWRSTVLNLSSDKRIRIDCGGVFSDVLHRPYVCSHIPLGPYARSIPPSNEIRRFANLTYEEFAAKWSNTPFVLDQCIQEWPIMKHWDLPRMLKMYSNVEFRAESVDWPFSTYSEYMSENQDESPLYLFDKKFAEKMSIKIGREDGSAYWRPECFGPDLFELLDKERPAHRWLIIGPERSGSTFHKDPNATSAWNAVIQGAKYWIMFPPSVSVPGVYVSADNSEVTSPLSIAEWLLEFHAEARELPECVEGVCRAGEILHVPSGWWHLVVNLERGIAVTQNFVPKAHLSEVLSFLRDRPEQVTGFERDISNPYGLFVDRLREEYGELLQNALDRLEQKNGTKKRAWDVAIGATGDDEEESGRDGGFSFGFGGDEDDDEDEIP